MMNPDLCRSNVMTQAVSIDSQNMPMRIDAWMPLMMAAIFVGGGVIMVGAPDWPVVDAPWWTPFALIGAGIWCALIDALMVARRRVLVEVTASAVGLNVRPSELKSHGRALVRTVMTTPAIALGAALVLWPMTQRSTGAMTTLAWATHLAVVTAMSLVVAMAMSVIARQTRVLVPAILAGQGAAVAGALMLTGSMKLGQSAFPIIAAAAAVGVGLLVFGRSLSAGAIGVAMCAIASLLVSGNTWSELSQTQAIILLLTPLPALLAMPIRKPSMRFFTGLLLAAIPATVVVIRAAIRFNQELDDSGY